MASALAAMPPLARQPLPRPTPAAGTPAGTPAGINVQPLPRRGRGPRRAVRGPQPAVAPAAVAAARAGAGSPAGARANQLATAAAIRALPPAQAARHLPARMTGVVTFYDRLAWRRGLMGALYVQDPTGGIFVDVETLRPELRAGERVRVIGYSGAGGAAPILVAQHIQVLGVAPLPPPQVINLRQAATGLPDAQWISVEGVVQSEQFTAQGLILQLNADLAAVPVRLPLAPGRPVPHWVDAGVRVQGVLANIFIGTERSGVAIFAPGVSSVTVVQPAPTHPFQLPLHPIADLLRFTPWGVFPHRVRIQGVVVAASAHGCEIQDATGGAWVAWATGFPAPPQPALGAVVTAAGFPALMGGMVRLQEARLRRLRLGPPPAAVPLPAAVPVYNHLNGRLAFAIARLRDASFRGSASSAQFTLYLSRAQGPLEATLFGAAASRLAARHLAPGSLLRLTGIALPAEPTATTLPGPLREWRLWLRGGADVVVLQAPPWWTGERLRWVLLAVAVLGLLALAWIFFLRRGLAQQARALTTNAAERSELERQLQQAQRLEALGRLAGGIAHDFNNLLTVVSGRAAMLLAGSCDGRQRPALEAIQGAAERAAALTRQLLAYSRRRALAPAPLDLGDVLREFEPMLRALMGDSIHLQVQCAAGLPLVFADRGPLEQVVMNLAINARDAMPQGGQLTLRAVLAKRGGPAASPGPFVQLDVTDTGMGMTEEVQLRIFEPFFTTKDPGQGTGLGLALVYGIMQESGGHITVRSTPGQGTTFSVFLPLAPAAVPRAARAAAG